MYHYLKKSSCFISCDTSRQEGWLLVYIQLIIEVSWYLLCRVLCCSPVEVCQYIAEHCHAQLFFCENAKQLEKIIFEVSEKFIVAIEIII